jgi:undecaprenyl-diphosphatase
VTVPFALKVILLAVIQGFAEFFPVSSSGHLLVLQKLLDFNTLPLVYDIFFHLGTLLAVVVYFFRDLKPLALRFYEKENLRMLLLIATASLPTALIGFTFKDFFEALFEKVSYLGFAFLFTAAVLLLSRFLRLKTKLPDFPAAFFIGVAQGIAIIPGVSRSGMTIAVALVLGLGFEFAFRFSFLLSIPAVLGAVLLEAGAIPWGGGHWPQLALAVLVAALAGFLALGLLKRILVRDRFHRFAPYLLVLGVLVFLFL